ncbi:MAG: MBL fold metallo-hydrolase [Candidatus Omnitrophota bacterium]
MDKTIDIEKIIVGSLATNCYLIVNKPLKEAILIDAGAEADEIKKRISRYGANLCAIFLTHAHIDHIAALQDIDAPIYIHSLDSSFLRDTDKNLSAFFGLPLAISSKRKIIEVRDGEIIKLAGMSLRIIHTPGHTPGSISIQLNEIIFTGDALFKGSVGRTDLPYGSYEALIAAIKNKLLPLGDDIKIYPGHGDASTLREEKRNNPFLI